jgi:FkbM family methyltransferase
MTLIGDNVGRKRFIYKNGQRRLYENTPDPLYIFIENFLVKQRKFVPQTVLDLGAWNGIFTRMCKQLWPNAHYTCIEAGPEHEYELQRCANEVHIAVVGDTNKECIMYHNKKGYTKGASLFDSTDYSDNRHMETLSSVVGGNTTYDLIKQDVQGAELLIMDGSPEIFQRAKYIILEVQVNEQKSVDEYMSKLGFKYNKIIPKANTTVEFDKIYWRDIAEKLVEKSSKI